VFNLAVMWRHQCRSGGACWGSLSIKYDHQLSYKKIRKLANLITHAFTINQVPHVFGQHHFAGHKYKYMEDFTERRFPTLICGKEQGRHPPNQLKMV
jgi:hypothetical protein